MMVVGRRWSPRGAGDCGGSGLRWTGSGHVWRRGCSGPSSWQCARGSAPRPVDASRRWYSHLGESSAPAGAGDGDACGRREPPWRRRCHGECLSENLGKPMFQVLLEQVMAAHFVSHPFLKASSRFSSVRLCGGCSLWVRWWWWCVQFGVDGGVCFVGEELVLCEIVAQPCAGMGLIFIQSRVSEVVILLNGSSRSHIYGTSTSAGGCWVATRRPTFKALLLAWSDEGVS